MVGFYGGSSLFPSFGQFGKREMIRVFLRKESSREELLALMQLKIANRACARKEFADIKIDNIMHCWGRCLKMGGFKEKMKVCRCLPPYGVLKFNVDGAAKGKPGLTGIEGVLRNHKGEVIYMFSKHVGINFSNETEVLARLEALRIYHTLYQQNLIVE
eukprot:TRINITY_DN13625_c0_g1_i4.p1 TRINITY_DN13625_c0_g1~~TRINITY_DN13625_c0_g1_i4.p1  ORF type:complete len:159 (-),score=28.79 TRINITY_DN13625_c0_g1_i4:37-513(-)